MIGEKTSKRSRYGCFTCRKRKKRCDEIKPVCTACKRLKLDCVYPIPGMERKNRPRKASAYARETTVERNLLVLDSARFPKTNKCDNNEDSSGESRDGDENYDQHISLIEPFELSKKGMALQVYSPRDALRDLDVVNLSGNDDYSLDGLGFDGIESFSPFLSLDEPDFMLYNQPKSRYQIKLDSEGQRLFEYFVSKQAGIICVSPENSFLNVFVPMANESDSVLYAIVAWAGFHENAGRKQEIGFRYLNKAMQGVISDFNKYELTTLAGLLLIAAAEICNGDVLNWNKHLGLAAQVIKMNGGLQSFSSSKTLNWLGTNFSYHDLLASSIYTTRNTYFAPSEYKALMDSASGPDALLGCCHALFQLLAEISDLSVEMKKLYKFHGSQVPLEDLREVQFKARNLQDKITMSVPDGKSLVNLTVEQTNLQLNLFEVFRTTAKLHLAQSVLRLTASSLEMQCCYQESLRLIDKVLGTSVEGGLIFPLFVTGVACCSPTARLSIVERFDAFYERNLARNIKRTVHLLEEVWKLDELGTRYVDWQALIEVRGWDLCFA